MKRIFVPAIKRSSAVEALHTGAFLQTSTSCIDNKMALRRYNGKTG
jgi:hypothetical protein